MADERARKGQEMFQENLRKAKENSAEYYRRLKQQVQAAKLENERADKLMEEKMKKVYKKSLTDPLYKTVQTQELEVPVDGELERGSRVYMMHCSGCHTMEASSGSGASRGPALGLIYNRRAGSDQEYEGYSEQLVNSNHYWTPRNLYNLLGDPRKHFPGLFCPISPQQGIGSEEDRADLLVFLREYSRELSRNIQLQEIKAKGYDLAQTEIYTQKQQRAAMDNSPQK